MTKRLLHPFTIDIQTRRWMDGDFCWAIRQGGQVVRKGAASYTTFEEARLAGKAVLDEMIASWLCRGEPNKAA